MLHLKKRKQMKLLRSQTELKILLQSLRILKMKNRTLMDLQAGKSRMQICLTHRMNHMNLMLQVNLKIFSFKKQKTLKMKD